MLRAKSGFLQSFTDDDDDEEDEEGYNSDDRAFIDDGPLLTYDDDGEVEAEKEEAGGCAAAEDCVADTEQQEARGRTLKRLRRGPARPLRSAAPKEPPPRCAAADCGSSARPESGATLCEAHWAQVCAQRDKAVARLALRQASTIVAKS